MKAFRLAVGFALVLGITSCGSAADDGAAAASMPEVVGLTLDVALSDIERAGFENEVEILGGGVFGVVEEGNWEVCDQLPAAGETVTETPRLTVDRECEGNEPEPTGPEATTVPTAPESTTAPATGSDSSTGESTPDEEAAGFSLPDGYYRFGETSSEISPSRFRPPTLVTVTAPEEFTPAEPAEQPLDVNMFFLVTFTNLSEDEGWSPTILTEACSDQEYRSFVPCSSPGELLFTDGRWTEYPDVLGPGESMTFRVEYSLASPDFVTLELDIDGQAGPTIRFMSEAVSVA